MKHGAILIWMQDRHKGESVDAILESLDPSWRKIADRLRRLTKKTLPGVVETVKWGNVTFQMNGENLSWILAYRDHLDYGFFKGALLRSELLEGTGKRLRHIKVRSGADVDERELARLIRDAAKLL